jgi:hypothetical protein
MDEPESLADAIMHTLRSASEVDSSGDAANLVDGLFAIARSIDRLAEAVDRLADEYEDDDDEDDD